MTRPGVDSEKLASVIDAISAEVSTVRFPFEVELGALQSSPLEDIPVCTIATEPGLLTYPVFDPLRVQVPPGRPSVYGSYDAASHVSWPL